MSRIQDRIQISTTNVNMLVFLFWIALFASLFTLLYLLRQSTFVKESFVDAVAKEAVVPGGDDTRETSLSPGGYKDTTTEKLVEGAGLRALSVDEARAKWATVNAERCFQADPSEERTQTRNYKQQTNNYIRNHPDSCSAPFKEFVGSFYAL